MNVVAAIVAVLLLIGYVGTLMWSIAALPFTIIVAAVSLVVFYDFVATALRGGNGGN